MLGFFLSTSPAGKLLLPQSLPRRRSSLLLDAFLKPGVYHGFGLHLAQPDLSLEWIGGKEDEGEKTLDLGMHACVMADYCSSPGTPFFFTFRAGGARCSSGCMSLGSDAWCCIRCEPRIWIDCPARVGFVCSDRSPRQLLHFCFFRFSSAQHKQLSDDVVYSLV